MCPLLPARTGLFPLPCHLQPPPPESARVGGWGTGEMPERLLCTAAGLLPCKQNFLQVSAPQGRGPIQENILINLRLCVDSVPLPVIGLGVGIY